MHTYIHTYIPMYVSMYAYPCLFGWFYRYTVSRHVHTCAHLRLHRSREISSSSLAQPSSGLQPETLNLKHSRFFFQKLRLGYQKKQSCHLLLSR